MYKVQDSYYEQFKLSSFISLCIAFILARYTLKEIPHYFLGVVVCFTILSIVGVPITIFAIFLKNKDIKNGLRINEHGLCFNKSVQVTPWSEISA